MSEFEELYSDNRIEMDRLKSALEEYLDTLRNSRNSEYLTGREVMDLLRISDNTLRRYRQQGILPSVLLRNSYRYPVREVYMLLKVGEGKMAA